MYRCQNVPPMFASSTSSWLAGLQSTVLCMLICKRPLPRRALGRPSLIFMTPVGPRFFRPLSSGYMDWNRSTETKVAERRRSHKWRDNITRPEILGTLERSVFFTHRAFPAVASNTDTYLDLASSWNALLNRLLSKVRALFSGLMSK